MCKKFFKAKNVGHLSLKWERKGNIYFILFFWNLYLSNTLQYNNIFCCIKFISLELFVLQASIERAHIFIIVKWQK